MQQANVDYLPTRARIRPIRLLACAANVRISRKQQRMPQICALFSELHIVLEIVPGAKSTKSHRSCLDGRDSSILSFVNILNRGPWSLLVCSGMTYFGRHKNERQEMNNMDAGANSSTWHS